MLLLYEYLSFIHVLLLLLLWLILLMTMVKLFHHVHVVKSILYYSTHSNSMVLEGLAGPGAHTKSVFWRRNQTYLHQFLKLDAWVQSKQ